MSSSNGRLKLNCESTSSDSFNPLQNYLINSFDLEMCPPVNVPFGVRVTPIDCNYEWQTVGSQCTGHCFGNLDGLVEQDTECLENGIWSSKFVKCEMPNIGKCCAGFVCRLHGCARASHELLLCVCVIVLSLGCISQKH